MNGLAPQTDPQADVAPGIDPMLQCAFEMSMFNVSAIHISSRSWLRSSSTHEPSDPPFRVIVLFKVRRLIKLQV